MVRAPLVPELVSAAEVATGLIPEEGLAKGSLVWSEGYAAFVGGLSTLVTYCSGIALPVEAISKLRDEYFSRFERLNSHPEDVCLARVDGRAYCNVKLTATRAGKESRRCRDHANSDLLGVVLNQPDAHPACLSVCPACS